MSENTDKRTATQRIEDLERVVATLYEEATRNLALVQNLAKGQSELKLIKDAIKLLNHKSEAIIMSASESSGITNESVNKNMINLNVMELKKQVEISVANGTLVSADVIADGTYVVCEEVNPDGTIANPRVQFPLAAQPENVQQVLKGKKAGDLVNFGQEGSLDAKVLEVYTLVDVEKVKAEATAAATTDTSTAPATDTASDTNTSANSSSISASENSVANASDTSTPDSPSLSSPDASPAAPAATEASN